MFLNWVIWKIVICSVSSFLIVFSLTSTHSLIGFFNLLCPHFVQADRVSLPFNLLWCRLQIFLKRSFDLWASSRNCGGMDIHIRLQRNGVAMAYPGGADEQGKTERSETVRWFFAKSRLFSWSGATSTLLHRFGICDLLTPLIQLTCRSEQVDDTISLAETSASWRLIFISGSSFRWGGWQCWRWLCSIIGMLAYEGRLFSII